MTTNPDSTWLLHSAMQIMDAWWDEVDCMQHLQPGGVPDTRTTMAYALGLLMRDSPGDADRALRAIARALAYQWDCPPMPHHGTFARSPAEFLDLSNPVVWADYDPNWREFMGVMLALVEIEFADRVPADLAVRIRASISLAAAGTCRRNVSPRYTNIALLSAWLLEYAGNACAVNFWLDRADALVAAIHRDFARHGTFAEYNSPTYYGTDLAGLAHWRRYGGTKEMRQAGTAMEEALWREIASFYHPGLRNLCGPWLRSYGCDMTRYCALLGEWIALATGPANAPLPDLSRPFAHGHDIGHVPWAVLLGTRVPPEVVSALLTFTGPRLLERTISKSPPTRVTAWLEDRMMIGALYTAGQCTASPARLCHPAMVHWYVPGADRAGWIRLLCESAVDAVAGSGSLTLRFSSTGPVQAEFRIDTGDAGAVSIGKNRWGLPGLDVEVDAPEDATFSSREDSGDRYASYSLPAAHRTVRLYLTPAGETPPDAGALPGA